VKAGRIHRLEIPYGRFERHIGLPLGDPYTPLELVGKALAEGVLTLTFRRKEGA
jgi:HSP20 family molecular chaperone IbpA